MAPIDDEFYLSPESKFDQIRNKFLEEIKKPTSLIAVVIFALVVGWLIYDQVSTKPKTHTTPTITLPASVPPFGPQIVDAKAIHSEIGVVGHAIYWAGAGKNQNLELTVLKNGTTYVRYLPKKEKAGTTKKYLTVVTFADKKGYEDVQASARGAGVISVADTGGAFVIESSKKSLNAYFAFKNYPIQVEVYDTTPGNAWNLIQTGKIFLVN